MPSSAVRTFSEPDDYATSIRATKAEMAVTGRGQFTAKLTRIDLHRLWMQRYSENLPRVAHSATVTGRAIVSFRTQPGPTLLSGGIEFQPNNVTRLNEGQHAFQRSSGAASFASMSLPIKDMVSVGEAMGGCDLTPPRDAMLVTPRPAAMARLQRLHAAAGHLAEHAPEIIANLEAAWGLEQALIEAMVECLSQGEKREHTLAQSQHAIVMRRFAGWWKRTRSNRFISQTYAIGSGSQIGHCGCAARSIWA